MGKLKTLRVAGFYANSTVNGPGVRSVIFLAGCKHNCKGCQNKEIQDYNAGSIALVKDILKGVERNKPYLTGVTISGGEPFDQDISDLAKGLKDLGMNVWVYTGYTIEQLMKSSKDYIPTALQYIDVVVDGKFDITKTDNAPKYVGSTNQRFIYLKNGEIDQIRCTCLE